MPLGSSLLGGLASEGFRLPITRRGLFASDDFFKGFQDDYNLAIGDVLERFGSRSRLADRFASYKKLREKDRSDDSQAATVSDTPGSQIIVIDMNDYASGQITVETSGFAAVVKASIGERKYERKFPLPSDTVIDGVVADLSDDNILTVTAPRKGRGETAVQKSPSLSSTSTSSTSASTSTSSTSSSTRLIPLDIEGGGGEGGGDSIIVREIPTLRQTDVRSPTRVLNIKRRGRFFQDATFENAWRDFETAMDEMLNRRGSRTDRQTDGGRQTGGGRQTAGDRQTDRLKEYEDLRKVVKGEEGMAGTVSKEGRNYKVVLDVKEFADGNLDVKAVTGAITILGQKGTRSFERRFSLPNLTLPEEVSAALSTDGILTITAPMQ